MATKKTARKSAPRAAKTTKAATKKKTSRSTKKKTAATAGGGGAAASSTGSTRSTGRLYTPVRVERMIGGRPLILETGRMARQADGAIVALYGETMVLATVESAQAREDIDFFPLTVDYREKAAAAGKFPGGFFKREGRPTTREILTCRIIDRSIRPLFPDGYRKEVQVLSQVFSTDQENESDILGAVASFAALAISSIPNGKTLGACRIGLVDDKLIVNPSWTVQQSPECSLNLTVAAHKDAIAMVEAGGNEITEARMLEALDLAHEVCSEIAGMIDELVAAVGKTKQEFEPPVRNAELDQAVRKFEKLLLAAPSAGDNKFERKASMKAAEAEVVEALPAPADATPQEVKAHQKYVKMVIGEIFKEGERAAILRGRRADGRDGKTIRQIDIEIGVLPRVHGSVLFTRGETQTLSVATLGTSDDAQFMDGIYPEPRRRFLLHYTFPPFSVGEVKRFGFVGRREIGHGALAERALAPVLPGEAEFPYTLRVTSEILESNGSSSMATVCGATLALMDAGVPIKQPVAGIAMGLVIEGKKTAILTDILGSEDHCGDMDFKVAGTGRGITALQMDIKCEGLSRQLLEDALAQAREARLQILRTMLTEIRAPREDISPNAPRLESIQVPVEKIGLIIGPGGRNIRQMQTDYEVRISVDDQGRVQVAGVDGKKVKAAIKHLEDMTAEVALGSVYTGRVTSIKEFGAFIEILPGQEGLCHVSELSNDFIRAVTDVVRIGDEVQVKVIGIDDFGKIKLSKRAIDAPGSEGGAEPRERPERGPRERPERGPRERPERGPRERVERPERGDPRERVERPERGDPRERVERSESGPRERFERAPGGDRDRGRPEHGRGRDRGDRGRGHGVDREDRDRGRPRRDDDFDARPPRERQVSEPRGFADRGRDRFRERGDRDREPLPADERGEAPRDRDRGHARVERPRDQVRGGGRPDQARPPREPRPEPGYRDEPPRDRGHRGAAGGRPVREPRGSEEPVEDLDRFETLERPDDFDFGDLDSPREVRSAPAEDRDSRGRGRPRRRGPRRG